MRQRHISHYGTQRPQAFERGVAVRLNTGIERVGEILGGATDDETGEWLRVVGDYRRVPQRGRRQRGAGGIVGVVTRDELHAECGIEHILREDPNVVE